MSDHPSPIQEVERFFKGAVSFVLRRVLAKSLFPLLRLARWTGDAHFVFHMERVFEAASCRTLDRDCDREGRT